MYVRVLATVHTRVRALAVYIFLYTYTYVYAVYMCAILSSPYMHNCSAYLLFPDVSQVTCQANVQCVLVYTINISRVFLLFSTSDTAHGT